MNIRIYVSICTFIFILLSVTINSKDAKEYNYSYQGKEDASYILVEYASLSCVHCANFHNKRLTAIKEKLIDTGKLKYVYKDFPLDFPAMKASMLTHCFKNKQYFDILNTLFRNQKKWIVESGNDDKLTKAFHSILKEHGLTSEKIASCIQFPENSKANKVKWDFILSSRLEGQKKGVNSTPTFFLNGKKLEGLVTLKLLEEHIY